MNNCKELSYHTIQKIRTLKVRNRFTRLNGKNSARAEHAYGDEFVVKELITDRGAMGWGLFPGPFWKVDREIDRRILGKKAGDIFDPDLGVTLPEAMPFDFALHDLAGKILDLPVFRMLGGQGNNPVPCYDGAILMDDISPDSGPRGLEGILEECRADYALGYRAFKLKVGRAPRWMNWDDGIKRDIEITRLVRENFPGCDVMVDANNAYTPDTIRRYIEGVADCGLFWIEEPFKENSTDFRYLRDYLDKKSPGTMIADGESDPDVEQLLALAAEGVLDVLQMDIDSYGFTPWRRLMPRIQEANVMVSPHNWGYKLKTHYTASFGVGCPQVNTIEGVVDETEGVDFSGYRLNEGKLIVPDRPGFGMDLIWGMELLVSEV